MSEQKLRDLITKVKISPELDDQIYPLLTKLRKQLDGHSGKKVYGYLPKNVKATVNEVLEILSAEPSIAKLYKEWNKINQEKLSLYYENKDSTVPLVDNKEFRSIKNAIIRAVLEMKEDISMAKPTSASVQAMATAGQIIASLARLIGEKCAAQQQHMQEQIDSRLQAKINEKKQAMGLRTEQTQKVSYQTQEEYEMSL